MPRLFNILLFAFIFSGVVLMLINQRWRSWFTQTLQWMWAIGSLLAFCWVFLMAMGSNIIFINHPLAPLECAWKKDYSLKHWIRDLQPTPADWKKTSQIDFPEWLQSLKEKSDTYHPLAEEGGKVVRDAEGNPLIPIVARIAINFRQAWKYARMRDYFTNSLVISVTSTCILTLLGGLAAHGLCRFDFAGRKLVSTLFIIGLTIPLQLLVIPLFLQLKDWKILGLPFMDSRLGLIVIYSTLALPFTIFLLTGFWRGLPHELAEAAAIDGCNEWLIFKELYFPLAQPALITTAILNFLHLWNELNLALVFITNPDVKTLPVGLYNLQVTTTYAADWPALFAGMVLLLTPTLIVFLLLQKRIIHGLTVGGVKE